MSIIKSIVGGKAGCGRGGSISYKSKYPIVLLLLRASWSLGDRVQGRPCEVRLRASGSAAPPASSAGLLLLLRGRRVGDKCLTTVLSIGLSTSLATGSGAAGSGLLRDRERLVGPGGLGLDMVWVEVRSKGLRGEVRVVGGLSGEGLKGGELRLLRERSGRVG